ncbi:phosphate ABC transporter permease PstA [Candidatus Nitronereus thalassa]|uniref:Phosphate transport system permease protein PstA n=1 Tax=Candidatus Nitronereus thalassa TaxID=3020898 RepID=A0ABU3K9Q9_9BACT|nr:phosphate ABC transporter permease PstA [Candidatus Nitronereus thalassa]MDT7043180.1 phosphate ABC transporter permease PstA [Candidatus Nitronereus thalassa]
MRDAVNKFLSSGTLFVWLCGAAVAMSLLMIGGILVLIMVNGLGFFWPHTLYEMTLKDGSRLLGELQGQEVIPNSATPENPEGKTRIRMKIGNRDLYGLDFQWVDEDDIVARSAPQDVMVFERREWGNFYGRIQQVIHGDTVMASDNTQAWKILPPLIEEANQLHEDIDFLQRVKIGDINHDIEQARLKIRALQIKGISDSPEITDLQVTLHRLEQQYQQHVETLRQLDARLADYTLVLVDTNGREKSLPLGQIVEALRPNDMGIVQKCLTYLHNFWKVLSDEPREANTEGGIFPAIFGTVMMVLIMSIAVVPFGVLAAFYLKEYARQGAIVRIVRIAVNNLAGVPSIVFGVFGLGFFVYAVGGTIDQLFYPEALPNPTFGTGGILWASLTLALMTVPVVIVATEESLSAVPREYREGSLALGATKFESMLRVILPCAMPGILTGLILAVARATGEVAPLMLTGVVKLAPALPLDFHFPFLHLDRKFMHLGFHIYDVGFQSPNVEAAKPMVYVTTFILVMVVIALNISAIALRNHMRKKFKGAAV